MRRHSYIAVSFAAVFPLVAIDIFCGRELLVYGMSQGSQLGDIFTSLFEPLR